MSSQNQKAFSSSFYEKLSRFRNNPQDYLRGDFKEASTRLEFIDPLLIELGWDVYNSKGLSRSRKDVLVEPPQESEGRKRAPDYALRAQNRPPIFVEAKKPSLNIATNSSAAQQVRSYVWSANAHVGILTNFKEIAIYDGRLKPDAKDDASVARLFLSTIDQLEQNFDFLLNTVGRESVLNGSVEDWLGGIGSRKGREPVDKAFLRMIEAGRLSIISGLDKLNPKLSNERLSILTQVLIDRIVFLRVCEDRSLEPFGSLRDALASGDPAISLSRLFDDADRRYNAGLFSDDIADQLLMEQTFLSNYQWPIIEIRKFVDSLYPPTSPFEFSVVPSEILGMAYEEFLAKEVVRSGEEIKLELKPEIRKAGGVFYTPAWLVENVVDATLGPKLENLSPKELRSGKASLRVLDPAAGSGSFLVGAYRHLCNWYLDQYARDFDAWLASGTKSNPSPIEKALDGSYDLTFAERKRILRDHIFGVDIDTQAVEVSKLSLFLELTDGLDLSVAESSLAIFRERLLPDMDGNVKVGNSLVGTDVVPSDQLFDFENSDFSRMVPFSWEDFGKKFDSIVGNPPWLMAGYNRNEIELQYLKETYKSYKGKADLYYLFIEKSLGLLTDGGNLGLVVPNKMQLTSAAEAVRKLLIQNIALRKIVDFRASQIFEGATNYTQVLLATNLKPSDDSKIEIEWANEEYADRRTWEIRQSRLGAGVWNLLPDHVVSFWGDLAKDTSPLSEASLVFGNGVQSGKDPLLVLDITEAQSLGLEPEHLRPMLKGKDIKKSGPVPSKLLVFPYLEEKGEYRVLTEDELRSRPALWQYLHDHKAELVARKWFGKTAEELSGAWWGMMYLDRAENFRGNYLLAPAISREPNFAVGEGSFFPTGSAGATSVNLGDLSAIAAQAILNSKVVKAWAWSHFPIYSGNYYKFSGSYLRTIPVRLPDHSSASRQIWDELADLQESLSNESRRNLVDELNRRIEKKCLELYQVDEVELKRVVESIAPL